MINVALCDDEKTIVAQMESIILDVCSKENIVVDISVFFSGEALEKSVMMGARYDILFLDIQMSSENGIEAASNIRKMDENMILIFVSGYDRYLMELFRLDVLSFIKKPIDDAILTNVFLEANKKVCNRKIYFSFRYKSEEYKVLCSDILYFESNGRKVNIVMRNGEIESFYGKLSEVEIKLAVGKIPFLRIHQSYLVNYHMIKSRSKSEISLLSEEKLPISEERQKEFNKQYSRLLGGEIDV